MKVAAFFDMDDTLLAYNTGSRLGYYLWRQGDIHLWDLTKSVIWSIGYRLSILDLDALVTRLVLKLKDAPEHIFQKKSEAFMKTEVFKAILPKAVERLDYHRKQGHTLVLLSSAFSYMAEPLAQHLSLDAVLCTRLNVKNERFTGTCQIPICYGSGKVYHAEQFSKQQGIDLKQSFFYTDSFSDLPMLLRIGNPRIVNADPRLKRYAQQKGWVTENWKDPY